MLKKFLSIVCVAAMSTAFVGCEPTTTTTDTDAGPDVVIESSDTDVTTKDATVETDATAETPAN